MKQNYSSNHNEEKMEGDMSNLKPPKSLKENCQKNNLTHFV